MGDLYIVWEGTAQAETAGERVNEYCAGAHFGAALFHSPPEVSCTEQCELSRDVGTCASYRSGALGLHHGKDSRHHSATVRAAGGHSQAKHVTHCLRLTDHIYK
eukprot:SAG31_NODE_149_length_22476_cov_41.827189_11_plen_104_part_00